MNKDQAKDKPAEDVIDAEFEPVDEAAPKNPPTPSPVGWPLLWTLFVIAIIFGGVFGTIGGKLLSTTAPTLPEANTEEIDNISKQLDAVKQQLQQLQTQITAQNKDSAKNKVALQQAISANSASITALQDTGLSQQQTAASTQQLQDLIVRIEALESRPEALPLANAEIDIQALLQPLQQQLEALKQRIEAANKTPQANAELETRLQALEMAANSPSNEFDLEQVLARLENIESINRQNDTDAIATLALAELKLAAQGSDPFPVEYAAAKLQFMQHDGLQKLAPIAATGAPTRQQLQLSLQSLIPDLLRAANRADDKASLSQKTGSAIRSLVSIRRTDGKGSALEIKLATAEKLLASGDLASAIKEIDDLKTNQTEASLTWVRAAQNRLRLEQVISDLLTQHSNEADQ